MKLTFPGRRSGNLEDHRGAGSQNVGSGTGLPIGVAGGGIGGLILLVVLALLGGNQFLGGDGSGFDPGSVLRQLPQAPAASGQPPARATDPDAGLVDFVSVVLDDVQNFWDGSFQQSGNSYTPAKLVLFTNATRSGCGSATADVGPFYCSVDETAYLDLDFFRDLTSRFGAPGDFAQAYVIAHELGHHVQRLTGVSDDVRAETEKHPDRQNDLSVRQELQADCLAGVWAHSTYERGILENGDLEEGLGAAAAVGDDRLQKQAGARVNSETWTHGSSEERVRWFRRGFDNGDPADCDTFSGDI
jgi:hypothetical protein